MKTAGQLAMEKGLPASTDAEQLVLGTCIVGRSVPPAVLRLAPEDFSVERHRRVFRAILALNGLKRPIEYHTVVEVLDNRKELDQVGGIASIAGLTDGMPVLSSIGEYVRIVREKAILRRLAVLGQDIAQRAIEQNPPNDIIEQSIARLENARLADPLDAEKFTLESLDREYQRHADLLDEQRIRLGLDRFDELTGGVSFGEVVTCIARTGVGKSALAQNLIANVLRNYPDLGVVFFSLEMPRLQAFERQLMIHAGVERGKVTYAYRNDRGLIPVDEFVRGYSRRLLIVDNTNLDLTGIKQFIRGAVAAKLVVPVGFIVIDYLGLLDRGNQRASLTERVSVLAREVKQMAKQLEAVVLLVAQTSRSAGDGSAEVTVLDARDSGAIEDSADFLLGCWRPELKKAITPEEYAQYHGDLCVSILKNRRGPRDRFSVRFDTRTLRIDSKEARRAEESREACA